jgi:competence protein ComEC
VAGAAYAVALGLGLAAWRAARDDGRGARRMGGAALALGAAAATLTLWPALRPADGRLRVVVLDVGQGDAIVVEGPDGRAVLVDAGSGGPYRLDAGERVVAPFLWNRGHLRLAGTVTTHPDSDHAGGMGAIHRLFPVGERWDVRRPLGEPLALGGAIVTPLGGGGPAAGVSDNDRALVLRVDYGLASFLLASDIEVAAERRLAASGAVLAATVLKVPHHGARTSTSPLLAAAVRPSVAVVSVGARNAYGHPDPDVLARLAAAGARIFRTDRDGAVVLETDGRVLEITRWATRATERLCLDPETIC